MAVCAPRPEGTSGTQNAVTIDATQQEPISPYVYGLNFPEYIYNYGLNLPEWDKLGLGFTTARLGGNRMTAYNWENNASNAGNDYHNQSDGAMGESNEPGWTDRTFLQAAQAHGAACLITIPTEGYVAADKGPAGDVNLTPNYLGVRFLKSYARKPGGHYAYPPDTSDRAVYQDECVVWIERIAKKDTPVWFALDNEPDTWAGTHSRICLAKPTYASIIANNIDFGGAIKEVAPSALVFGPAHYGWQGIRSFQDASDAHGRFFTDVYLDAMKEAEAKAHHRILDVYDIHYYPEARGDDVRVTENKDSAGLYAARIQSPRSLWDPTYVEKSWITQSNGGKPVRLIADIQERIQKHCPGTKLSITEYNFGGNNHISGTIAQADVLGIFGRYGVFAACNWGMGPNDRAEIAGFRSFLNYDGKGAHFADQGLKVGGEEPEANSVYAALDSKNPQRMTVVVINKTAASRTETVTIKGFVPKSAKAFTIAGADFDHSKSGEASVGSGEVTLTTPPLSVTTVEIGGDGFALGGGGGAGDGAQLPQDHGARGPVDAARGPGRRSVGW